VYVYLLLNTNYVDILGRKKCTQYLGLELILNFDGTDQILSHNDADDKQR